MNVAKNVVCLNCGESFILVSASQDAWGWHTTCKCGASFDIDITEHLIPAGTTVMFGDNRIGIVDGNDEANSDELENVNYYICPIEFTAEKVWSKHYIMLRAADLMSKDNADDAGDNGHVVMECPHAKTRSKLA